MEEVKFLNMLQAEKGHKSDSAREPPDPGENSIDLNNEAFIRHLPKFKSDHVPVLIDFNLINLAENNRKPFRFLAAWLLHDGFKHLLMDSWITNRNLNGKCNFLYWKC